ncbi:MAG: hypothetical protein R6X18_08265 [Chloroflexota bacterium]|jgi:hypothetical protein
MIAVKRIVTINDPQKLILNDLPFQVGQKVEILILAEDMSPEAHQAATDLRNLFRVTQALPQPRAITEDEIASEIASYRSEYEDRH